MCVGLGRCGLDADGDGTFDIRLSSVWLRCAAGRLGTSPLDVRWWCVRRGLDSDRGREGARADADDEPFACDMRLTRSVLPLAGRLCLPSVGDELCER